MNNEDKLVAVKLSDLKKARDRAEAGVNCCGCSGSGDAMDILEEIIKAALDASAVGVLARHGSTITIEGGITIDGKFVPSEPGAEKDAASAEPSAPVEVDERADFEAAYSEHEAKHTGAASDLVAMRRGEEYRVGYNYLNGAWFGWQARATLERNS